MINGNNIEGTWDDDEPEEEVQEAGGEPVERVRITATRKQEPLRLDKYLMHRVEGATRNKIQQAIDDGNITVNGNIIKCNYKVKPDDEIIIYETRKAELNEVLPENIPISVAYEDDALLLVNKVAGMVVHPGCGNYHGTLVNALAYYLHGYKADPESLHRVGLVHRIDKDTTGLLVIAKTGDAMTKLAAQFKAHTVHRRYTALVWGDIAEDEGTITGNIGRNLRFRKIMDVFPDGEHGKEAITHYKVLERFNYVTLVEMRLETGRTHQIRVHMRSIGHPLFGDATYGGDSIVKGTVFTRYKQFVENCLRILPRQALHARELGFKHPVTGDWMQFASDLPEDLAAVIDKWRTYTTGMNRQLRERMDNA